MQKINEMLQLQQQLNDSTNGLNWEEDVTKNGKKIDWKRCIYMECAEMIDSFAWKHWKNIDSEPNWDNLKIEVVDIWHFVMSLILSKYKVNHFGSIEDIATMMADMKSYSQLETTQQNYDDSEVIIEKVEQVMVDVLSKTDLIPQKLLTNFFELTAMCGLNLQTLYELYVGKNILNKFRQDNGYKDGSYIKIWNGEEDNVVMKKIWEQDSSLTPDRLYKGLAKAYKGVF
ncbi:MAG: dUTP diphosphatase [Campylobacterota bacterium]|nr:dUTP diphosphatase [Campylobacterota bacterium]